MKGERSCILNIETYNTYFDLKVFVHGFEILKGSLQIVIDHIFRGNFILNWIYMFNYVCHVLRGGIYIKIHEMFVIIKKGEIINLKGYR